MLVESGDKDFLGAFAKLRKATISFVMSVRPSARNNSPPTGRIFLKFDTRLFFENPRIIKFGHEYRVFYIRKKYIFFTYFAELFLKWDLFVDEILEKNKTLFVSGKTFFRKSWRLWDKV